MKISLDLLTVIDAIDRRGSFAAAAAELYRVPSAITYSVNKLEQDLGIKIFDRSGHRATLTDTGHELLREGRSLLQSAARLEAHVQHVAMGWESELRIAVGDLVPLSRVLDLLARFFDEFGSRTRIRLSQEVYGGSWDALANDRADLVIGAPSGIPAGGGYATQPLASVEFVFVVAPGHPLASLPGPLSSGQIKKHRAVSAADSSRSLSPRTSGLISGQDVLTVHDMWQKRVAQIKGLGVGFLPRFLVSHDLAVGDLLQKPVEEMKEPAVLLVAWPGGYLGKASAWFRSELAKPQFIEALFSDIDPTSGY